MALAVPCAWRLVISGLALAAAVVRLAAQAPDLPFSSGSTGADGAFAIPTLPVAGGSAALAYDPVRQETVMFDAGQTWALKNGAWRRLRPTKSPSNRAYAAMAFDAVRQQIVLFGGHGPGGGVDVPNDTWVWDGADWTLKNPTTKPNGRFRPGMAFDEARGVAVMFGGSGTTETWEWDGADWKRATGATPSKDGENGGICYDVARQEVLFATGNGRSVDLWAYKGTDWVKKSPASTTPTLPPPRLGETGGHRSFCRFLGYDAARQQVVLFGGAFANDAAALIEQPLEDAWIWNGEDWTKSTSTQLPPGRFWGPMAFDASLDELVLFGGYSRGKNLADTWTWNGARWRFVSGNDVEVDMAAKPDGIWNFTTIDIPAGVTIRFKRNAANTPVRWLATGDVTINGKIDLNGQTFGNRRVGDVTALGGPGGFDGGPGGVRFDSSGSFAGKPGQGPAGGAPGTGENAQSGNGQHSEAYGNIFLQPLIGGSGGGGSGSDSTTDGVPGAGGGGAMLISSSRDITVNGTIQANGGLLERCCGNRGGSGAGGAVLLRADRILGTGKIEAVRNGQPNGAEGTEFARDGRIRLEAYFREMSGANLVGAVAQANPTANGELNFGAGELRIVSIAGQVVPQPPTGSRAVTDVVFSEAGPINIAVAAPGAPDGTRVIVRVTHETGILTSDPVLTAGGNATANLTVPRGVGTVLAFTQVGP
jgi:hypothetical protein